ncbi:hypothetical protein Taro_040144 [Colocasia esculenta]|uniref:Uncharacterized protein n=1 Tax=Colocasia esculenta TaxID=4460 RepID=A0A843W872_COLES|nr:hypothetical protein [Colocasia esculenta]
MWTFRVAVAIGGRGVDANLRILQLEDCGTRGVAELRKETSWRGAILVGARGGFGVNREIAGAPVVLVCSVLGEFPTEPVTSEAHPYPHRNLEWLIEEIGVVEEMIRRKAPSV